MHFTGLRTPDVTECALTTKLNKKNTERKLRISLR
jgi:hypothetical protein